MIPHHRLPSCDKSSNREVCRIQQTPMAFIDYEKAFDSVEIPAVLEALRREGICDSCVNTIANTYKYSTATVLLLKKSRKIPIQKGVRQGETIYLTLLAACFEEIFKRLDSDEAGLRNSGEYLSKLRFADIVLFSNDGDELQNLIEDLSQESSKV